jgi:beta-glucosidase
LAGVDVVHAAATAPQDGDEAGFGAARQALAQADAVVLCLGETREMSGEAASRAALGLTGRQRALAEMVLTAGKPVVTVLFTGRPLVLPWLFDRADCVLCAWWPGSEAGNALADVLLGRQEASGRLAMSWPRHEGQIPIFHGQRPTGRPTDGSERYASRYIDQPVTPQFPFGYGLPQAHLALGPLVCDDPVLRRGNALRVNVTVSNSSERSATETLLAFMRPAVSKVARPVTTLIGFRRMTVPAGQTFLVDWRFIARDFSLAGIDYELRTEPGFIDLGIWHHAAGLRGSAAAPLLRIRIEP